jgi:hypothetical protein
VAAGVKIQHKRKATNFVAGELSAGECGVNTTTGLWFFSVDGATVTPLALPNNASVADQTINAASSALLTGSLLAIPVGKLRIGTMLRFRLSVSKTAAGTAANTFIFRLGTNGTIADAAIITFTLPVGTAVIDAAEIDITITIRGPLSVSCVAVGMLRLVHNLQITGFATVPCVVLSVTSGTFNATTANLFASLSCTTAVSTVLTFQQVQAEALNL